MKLRIYTLTALLLMLSACGGGGGSTSTPTLPPAPVIPELEFTSNLDEATGSVLEGETVVVQARVANVSGTATYTWKQLSGPPVELQKSADGSQITFVAPNVYRVANELIELTVEAAVNGQSSELYGASIAIINEFGLVDVGIETSALVMSSVESQYQLMSVAQTVIQRLLNGDSVRKLCQYDSSETVSLSDTDQSGGISIGDKVQLRLEECYVVALKDNASGFIDMTITEYDATLKTISVEADFARFLVNSYDGEFTFEGTLNLSFTDYTNRLEQTLSIDQPFEFLVDNRRFLNISQATINRVIDYTDATMTTSFGLVMSDPSLEESLVVEQIDPLRGIINDAPSQGRFRVSLGDDSIELIINEATEALAISMTGDGIVENIRFADLVEGNLFSLDGSAYVNLYSYSQAGRIGDVVRIFPVENEPDVVFEILFNRPLDSQDNLQIPFTNYEPPYPTVNFVGETSGAIMRIRLPQGVFIENGRSFDAYSAEVLTTNLQRVDVGDLNYTTPGDVIPKITGTSLGYRDSDYPTLDAVSTIINAGSVVSYEWYEVTDNGAIFSHPNDVSTTISLPSGITEDIEIGLRITNDEGFVGEGRVTLQHISSDMSFVVLDSAQNDYIGQGRPWLITGMDDFELSITVDPSGVPDVLQLTINQDSWFTMSLASLLNEQLMVGIYENAERFPFQSEGRAGFDFSGDGRGCNTLIANFEILELVRDGNGGVSTLAVDFTQYCEGRMDAPLHGKLRVNSSLPIN